MGKRTCLTEGCDRPHRCLGLCSRHYDRKRNADFRNANPFPSREDLFWSRVNQGTEEGCWLWTRATDRDGYGVMSWHDGKQKRAPRISFFLTYGIWPDLVMHTCDTPLCCNPAHLRAGTHRLNAEDREQKGRGRTGVKNSNSKLTEDRVRDIRSRDLSRYGAMAETAREFGISWTALHAVVLRKTWKYVR